MGLWMLNQKKIVIYIRKDDLFKDIIRYSAVVKMKRDFLGKMNQAYIELDDLKIENFLKEKSNPEADPKKLLKALLT